TGPCASVSSGGTITVPSDATLSLSSGDTAQTLCQGEAISNISYSIGETGTNATVTGLPSGISGSVSGNNLVISGSSTIVGTHNFSVVATGSCGDSETLNGSVIINENLTPTVNITSSDADDEICDGTEIIFTATATNEGSNPQYQWKINGNNSGGATSSNTFSINSLNDQDEVSVELTSSETCTTSNPVSSNQITTTVLDNLDPSVIIEASDTDFCQGDNITFTATPTNGGTPTYQWKVNGNNVTGSGATFTTDGLNNGEEVSVVMTSTAKCATSSTATSNIIEVIVNPNLTPEVSITSNDDDNIICSGGSISFTASSVNGGSSPTYEWFVDGSSVGNNNATFTTSTLLDGQAVKVLMTSNEECLATSQAESEEIVVEIDNSLSAITPAFDYTNPDHNKTAICPVTSVTYKINPIDGARNYNWTYPSGWTVESQNANEIVLKANVNASGGQITVTATNDCGSSQTISETVTTGTAVLVDAGPDQTVCLGTNSINLAGQIGGAISQGKDFNWTVSVSGGGLSNQSGNNASNKLNATYTLPANIRDNGGTITFTISSEKPAGQCAIKTDEMVLTVLKNATISDPANKNQTVCIDTPIDAIEFDITDAGTDASASGLPAGLAGNFDDGTFTISGTPTEAGEFDYIVTTSGDCTGQQISQTGTINVNPNNSITDATNIDQTVCINTAIADMSYPINSSVTSVDITGMPAGISGSIVGSDFVLTGTPTESGSFTYILNTIGSCISASTTGTLTVNPDVTISNPTNKDQTICINTPVENIEFSITAPGS
ncbi:MAG TPA: hypothetical protein VJ973_04675, partial [Christiangramia sp.]|nr:hypothetical protein [Christiangramia sp.]